MAETSKTVHHALRLLRSLSEDGPASPTVLARRLGLSRTAVLRLLATLRDHDFARRVDATYDVGFGVVAVAASFESALRSAARPSLAALSDEWRETAVLSVRDGDGVVAVDQVVAGERVIQVQYHSGMRHRLGEAAHGRCLLAFDDTAVGDRSDLAVVRNDGYATSHDELEPGVSGLAAPVFDASGRAAAAIGIVAPTARMPATTELAPSVVAAARAVGDVLAARRSTKPAPAPAGL